MKSAREYLHGSANNFDMCAELVAEFLWHGCKIRVNYPDWIDKNIVDQIKLVIEARLTQILNTMIGKAYVNIPT